MTTQHTHHEHGEFDAHVVEDSSVPTDETTNPSAASEAETSTDAASSSSSEELATSVDKQEHALAEASSDVPLCVDASTNVEIPVEVSDTEEAGIVSDTTLEVEAHAAPGFAEVVPMELASAHQEELSGDTESEKKDFSPLEVSHPDEVATAQEQVQAPEAVSLSAPLHEDDAPAEVLEPVAEQTDPTTQTNDIQPIDVHEDIEPSHSAPVESSSAQAVQEELPEVTSSVTEATAIQETEQPQATSEEGPDSPAITFPYAEGAALIDARAEEVRPFTEFIAEFRQAEASLQATLRDSQADAFTLLTSVAANLTSSENQETPELIESTETAFSGKNDHVANSEPQETVATNVQSDEENTAATKSEAEAKPSVRPVSPLLRPASRLRLPRHNLGRHEREEAPQPVAEEPEAPVAKVEVPQPEVEAVAEPVAPRPARRYRFDRPAPGVNGATSTTSTSTVKPTGRHTQPTVQPKPEEKIEKIEKLATPAVPEAKIVSEAVPPTPEPLAQPVSKKHTNTSQEAESLTTAPVVEHSRRRHTQKEPQVAAPVQESIPSIEPSTPIIETPAARKEDVAPEDLPPLEYSELQKASSRRRRRHRSGSSTTTTHIVQNPVNMPESPIVTPTPIVPPAPIPTPAPMPTQSSRLPAASSEQANLYNIVSGYTVGQMNQGNEVTGPFMGPEPSPARGSIMSRDGRNTRAEARSTPPPALYSGPRSSEGGISTAAMTQFANVVGQALQTQTDRIVTEFRRVNQAPTNVSVSLPPFPSTERVGVFVDVANLLYSARTLRMGVDFGKLLDFLRGNRRLVRAHAYCPTSPQAGDEQMFLQAVKGLGYRITTKNYKTFSSGAKKADLDLDLCMDVVRLVDGGSVDCVVLVSGDSDFMPMLDYCSDHGVRVEVAAFDEAMSATLRQSCDLFINLSMLEEIRA